VTWLPSRPVVGVLHPGAMGAAVGSALRPRAGAVIWAAAGRSQATSKRAELADLVGVPDVAALARRSDVIISVCPPHAARATADEVAAALGSAPRRPVYVDANAVSPATVHAIAERLGVDRVVDGAIIGPPAWERGHTVLWLSGVAAPEVASLFAGSPFDARVLGPDLGAASALKACFALQSKALPAIWLEMAAAARAYGVEDELGGELERNGVDFAAALARAAGGSAKAWRWAGEMDEAADAVGAVDLPDGFSRAAAEIYRRLADGRLRP
jgi:3-hydroxyisobutyrate dehydrogenase-like beta-hydroxyacid dehydrogenase